MSYKLGFCKGNKMTSPNLLDQLCVVAVNHTVKKVKSELYKKTILQTGLLRS